MGRLEWLTHDHFAQRRGEPFDVAVNGQPPVSLELIEATEGSQPGGRGPDGQERMQFSVVFRGAMAPVLPQGTYRVTHGQLGDLDLFLVPIGPDSDGMRYEAAFG
jgi:hypothetical protein